MTKTIVEFVCHLSSLGITLEADENRLRCQAPEGILTPALRQEIGDRKPELLQFLQQAKQSKTAYQLPIQPVARDGHLPLSFAQQRLWFLHHLSPDSRSYNALEILQIQGPLNLTVLEQSLGELINRHEIFRTTFPTVSGEPIQAIAAPGSFRLKVDNYQDLSPNQQSAKIQQVAELEAEQAFDLTMGPLIQFRLLQLSPQKSVLLLKMHHIIYDGWSFGILIRELSALYEAFLKNLANPLPALSIQYADFAVWQRQYLSGEVLDKQLNYWQEQLATVTPVLALPTDRPRPAVQSFRGGVEHFQLDQNVTQGLKQLSQERGATLFMTLLAAFGVLLSRYSHQSDLLVGSPIANRNQAAIEPLIGFFANTLALRINLSENPNFLELLEQVKQTTLAGYAHQDLPFEMLVEKLQPDRDLSRNPLVQVIFALQNVSQDAWNLSGLSIESLPLLVEETVRCDLEVHCWETSEGLAMDWVYSTDLFDSSTIERMNGHFMTLLEGIIANPCERVSQLPLLTKSEQQQLLIDWNNTQVDYPQDKCIHQLFEEQVERTPDAVAVVFENQQLTYTELNCHANQLAHYLQTLGVGPEVLVGISVERSLEMIVGLLGILKAGGAYVPLDPDYPTERLQFMLEDCEATVLLTQSNLKDKLPLDQVLQSDKVLYLDKDKFAQYPIYNPTVQNKPNNLTYVIYTSGSTGQPKGVMIEHQSLVNLSLSWGKLFHVKPQSRLLQFGSFSFDLSIGEIATSLSHGACLYLAKKETLLPTQTLVDFLETNKITHSFLSPSALSVLPQANLSHLENMTVGGEACSINVIEKWANQRRLFNCYGPTEATVTATLSLCQANGQKPNIGKPLDNIRVYILDENQQILPTGIPGELCIAGVCLARGYLNRPDLTAEKFIEVNLLGRTERIYKTGDLATWQTDGNIEYLGRIDNQVKVRGFRIELGEIEAVLSQCSDVQTTAVIVREDTPGDQRLVAYVVLTPNSQTTSGELRQFLANQLPAYLVPNTFVILDCLPLTPNGKCDRRSLPVPDDQARKNIQKIAPRNLLESQLTQIWSEVLGISDLGVEENFFELGGHSLLAVRLISCIEQKLGKNLPLTSLFQNGTIASLAQLIAQETTQLTYSPLIPIQSQGNKAPFFAVHPIGGNVLCYADLARYLGTEQPFYGLQALGLNATEKPLSSIEEMATIYIKAIQTIQASGPYSLGGWSMGGVIAFEIAQQLSEQGQTVALLTLIDSYSPILLNSVNTQENSSELLPEDLNESLNLTYAFVRDLTSMFNQEIPFSESEISHLTSEDLLTHFLAWSKQTNILPPELGEQQITTWFTIFQANRQALFNYLPKAYPGKTIFFGAEDSSLKNPGWHETINDLECQWISGDHYSLIKNPILAEKLNSYLQQVTL
ncbi:MULTISPECIES: non-ribosomal peptide synthetase [Planktothrix]|uniref:Non ribosomal peptide synthetase, involved in microginin biosynthesis n=2 Tax=Planktothrix TaxID=54304 RepID=A0A6J7ZE17_PLARU|nr:MULTISPECIES: non-ribosomal peptide synthetase [Planktothrix]CAC5339766.1 non ribosomal peptide synthetase, involved in microginin biosynthesis [Planktothrix rubescens NIVA-CYA 18]CAD5985626.1 Linear gramicidin synthase subunit C [Planktothrix rubescens NIVA-CYA 18]CAQ48261.1 MicD protein [Planktothrix prolifica NIVA-CYA 98]